MLPFVKSLKDLFKFAHRQSSAENATDLSTFNPDGATLLEKLKKEIVQSPHSGKPDGQIDTLENIIEALQDENQTPGQLLAIEGGRNIAFSLSLQGKFPSRTKAQELLVKMADVAGKKLESGHGILSSNTKGIIKCLTDKPDHEQSPIEKMQAVIKELKDYGMTGEMRILIDARDEPIPVIW